MSDQVMMLKTEDPLEESTDNLTYQKDLSILLDRKTQCEIRNGELYQQLERLQKTDLESTEVETKVCSPVEDRRGLKITEEILQQVDGHFQVTLPWRHYPPQKLDNKTMAEQRALFSKRCLMKREEFLNDFIERRHA